MDINRIHKYLSYVPNLTQNSDDLLESILQRLSYLEAAEIAEVKRAYDFVRSHPVDLQRYSGEAYIIHPLRVLEFLIDIQPDLPSMQAALLHDMIEDTNITAADIEKEFGKEVAMLCEGLVKVGKVQYSGEDKQLETLKKTFLAMGKDLRVIFIKIADRLHNVQTLEYQSSQERKTKIALETLKVFVPIASRLGLYVYQNYLENGAFKILYPSDYKKLTDYLLKAYGNADAFRQKGVEAFTKMCNEEHISITEVKGRIKSPYRIRKKMKKYETPEVSKVMDILAFRVITHSVTDCYSMLGVIHKHYTPIFTKMKDYIAIPKPNGYKSLHTTVLGMFPFPVEIQIRTQEMDRIAEYGVAAHFGYKENEGPVLVSDKQAARIQQIQDIVQRYQKSTDKAKFKDELDIEVLQKSIYVYTPNGDIIELPSESTVLDFAFRVHTDVGLKFKNAFVNSRIVPIDYKLKTGDIVSIETFKNKFTVSKGRLDFLHTPSAKIKLNRHLRKLEKDDIIKLVIQQLNEKLLTFGLPAVGAKDDLISKRYKGVDFEQLMFRIYDKQTSIMKVLQDIYETLANDHMDTLRDMGKKKTQQLAQTTSAVSLQTSATVIIDGDKVLAYELCQTCMPKTADKIIAKSDRNGIKIHALHCEALKTITYNKLLEAHRKEQETNDYILRLRMQVKDTPGIMLQIFKIFDFLVVNIHDLQIKHQEENTEITVDLDIKNPYKMFYILEELKNKKDILKVIYKQIF